jgi:ankyrin repeat protein
MRTGIALLLFAVGLCAQPANQDADLLAAARKGNAGQVKALLESGASVNTKNNYGVTPLFFASWNGHTEVVRLLLAKGAEANVSDTFYKMTAIDAALSKSHLEVAKLLVGAGAKPSPNSLMYVASDGNAAAVAYLLEVLKPDAKQLSTALSVAEKEKHAEVIELLKKAGAQPAEKAK